MFLLHNVVQPYAWGATDGLTDLVGVDPTGGPQAELWVGTHPAAPSLVVDDPEDRTLAQIIAADPVRWLGRELASQGHTALPFLLKVLAVGAPLSLQAHPSCQQAAEGFAREEAAGVALDDPTRTYRDAGAKPEALVALEPTWALCGFREPAEAADRLEGLAVPELLPLVKILRGGAPGALREALAWVLHLDDGERAVIAGAVAAAVAGEAQGSLADPRTWVARLCETYPGDPAVLAPLLLEVVCLAPGQAVHLPAGNLHAYLLGAGVEIMAASDNVLRGGLTPKHVDIEELLHVVRFEAGLPAAPQRQDRRPGLAVYDAGETSFGLALVEPTGHDEPVVLTATGPSLLLATEGEVDVAGSEGGCTLGGGDALFLAPGEGPVAISGAGRLWWATTGDALPG